MIEGVAAAGPGGPSFGVPAAFFYAHGAHLDKTIPAHHRFQLATSDAVERLLLQLNTAVDLKVIAATESLTTVAADPPVSTFQAARRLVALGVSAAAAVARTTLPPGGSTGRTARRLAGGERPAGHHAQPAALPDRRLRRLAATGDRAPRRLPRPGSGRTDPGLRTARRHYPASRGRRQRCHGAHLRPWLRHHPRRHPRRPRSRARDDRRRRGHRPDHPAPRDPGSPSAPPCRRRCPPRRT